MRLSSVLVPRQFFVFALLSTLAVSPVPAEEHTANKPQHTNLLSNETSPYLLLHAHNPVDWRPWGPEALQAAQDGNKPIFLSIGYSSCYWCHVMEREVFENEEIAAYLNEHFVCIKVDREERPDIDDQYMLALQLYFRAIGSSQGGGWPLSMFLTPDAKPFAGGTYFPAEDKPGMPGFKSVTEQIHTLWTDREADLRRNGDMLAAAVARNAVPGLVLETVELDKSLITGVVDALINLHDPDHGGFFNPEAPNGPKFPSCPNLAFLQSWSLNADIDDADSKTSDLAGESIKAVRQTLDRMAMGGIRDHLGGGFHRYSVDREWRVPHFEKMLYDQAQIAEAYLYEYARTENPLYRQVAEETLDFVLREMTSPEGAFYSALDAETDGIEGQYYVWSREEIDALLGRDDARVFAAAYGLDEESRFEHGYVLYLPQPLAATAEDLRIPADQLETRLAAMREKLLTARQQRPPLLRDDKILTSWNGLMIRALALMGEFDGGEKYVAAAERAAKFVLDSMRDEEGHLLHSYAGGRAGIAPFLDDYAYFISGLIHLGFMSQDDTDWLRIARALMDQQFVLYWDERAGGFFYTSDDHEQLLARAKDAGDSALPNANAVSLINMFALDSDQGDQPAYREPVTETLALFAPSLKQAPTAMPTIAAALNLHLQLTDESEPVAADVAPDAPADIPSVEQSETQLALAAADELVPTAEASEEDAKKHDKLSATAYLSVDKVPAGGECNVAVVLNVKDGWHINANPAQPKYLIPTELTAKLPKDFELADIKYPAGEKFTQQGLDEAMVVYEGRVVLYGKLKAPAGAAGKVAQAEITIRYQSCNDQMCLRPMKLLLKGQFPIAAQGEKPKPVNESLFKPKRPQ